MRGGLHQGLRFLCALSQSGWDEKVEAWEVCGWDDVGGGLEKSGVEATGGTTGRTVRSLPTGWGRSSVIGVLETLVAMLPAVSRASTLR